MSDSQDFARQIAADPIGHASAGAMLSGLIGKDVLVIFMESYGRFALHGSAVSDQIDSTLSAATKSLAKQWYSSRDFLTSTTFGGLSWLAHASIQTGLPVTSQRRHDLALSSPRHALSGLFADAGWHTVCVDPANTSPWASAGHCADLPRDQPHPMVAVAASVAVVAARGRHRFCRVLAARGD